MNTILKDSTKNLYKQYGDEIHNVRNSLYSKVDDIAPEFAYEVKKMFDKKLLLNNFKPTLGELFPWVIRDLTDFDRETTMQISIGWFSIYLYTLFIDEYTDSQEVKNSEKFLAGSVLAKIGLTNLSKIVNGTKYELFVENALDQSILYQLKDVQNQNKEVSIEEKEKYSEGKNKIIYACAGALAAVDSNHADFIIEFTKSILLTFQYLDDLADFETDYYNNNYTVLLHSLRRNYGDEQLPDKLSIINELIASGSLLRVVSKINSLLSSSIILINNSNFKKVEVKESFLLLQTLKTLLDSFEKLLITRSSEALGSDLRKRKYFIEEVERYIEILAQST